MRTERKPNTHNWKLVLPTGSLAALPWVTERKISNLRATPVAAASHPPLTDWEEPQAMDAHWTAVTAYLADMDFPNEG
ncbi:MAG: hypothetical protein V3R94_08270 [Acidobacteriota bacterium]